MGLDTAVACGLVSSLVRGSGSSQNIGTGPISGAMKDLEMLLELDHPDCHSTDWTRKEHTGVPLVLASARLVGASIAGPVLRVVDALLSVGAGIPLRFAVGGMNGVLGALAASVQEDIDDARHDERVALDDARRGIWGWSVVATMRSKEMGRGGVG